MTSVRSHVQGMSIPLDETMETSPERCDPCTQDHGDIERESLSEPLMNFLTDVISPEEYSQAPVGGTQVASSQHSSPEFLMSLGIKVRDFAYENTLPAIIPVPRVPRQVQPAPRAFKRSQRDWDDDKDGSLDGSSLVQPLSEQMGSKKPRSLERKPTEPLEQVAQHTRTLERITIKRMCSIIARPLRRTLPTTPRSQLSASPPTSPLAPPLSHPISQQSEFIQTPSTFPFVVHVDDTNIIPAPQLDPESRSLSPHPVLYTRFTLDACRSPGCSPAPGPSQNLSSAPLLTSFLELPSPVRESGSDSCVRKRRGRGTVSTTPLNRYQLRQRPISSSRASAISRCSHQASGTSKPLPRRSRRAR